MITCLRRLGNMWKHRASYFLHAFSKLVNKIIMKNITKLSLKDFKYFLIYILNLE